MSDVPGYHAGSDSLVLQWPATQLSGILGEYLGRVYQETKMRPTVVKASVAGWSRRRSTVGTSQGICVGRRTR
jgi:hypothetical protein